MGDALYPYLPQVADLIREKLPDFGSVADHQAIAIVSGEICKAVVLYGDYTPENVYMHIASADPSWCQRGVLRGCFSYPFNQLRVMRVTAIVPKKNKHARRFNERLGFVHEGTHPRSMPDGGATCSYGMVREKCKWIT
jgi:RimJ/RimL family protein N-acetyltransferase